LNKQKQQRILIDKINKASNAIHKASLNSPANYMILSSKAAKYFDKLIKREQRKTKLEKIKRNSEKMNVITLCGSTKYKEEFVLVNKWLTLQGNIVISVSMFGHIDKEPLTQAEKITLDAIHKRKIDLADEIFVVNVDGYIGNSTKEEIFYAESNGKKIRFFDDEQAKFEIWKNEFYNRQIIEDWNK
jgi:hypothetical protein